MSSVIFHFVNISSWLSSELPYLLQYLKAAADLKTLTKIQIGERRGELKAGLHADLVWKNFIKL